MFAKSASFGMIRPLLIILWAVCFVPAVATPSGAQNTQSTESRDSSQPSAQSSAVPPSEKKVWTNDDLSGLHNEVGNSSFSSNAASPRPMKMTAQTPKRSAAWYRDQISKLQAKIPPLDEQMAELQAAIDGKPTGDAKKSVRPYSVRADDWSAELDQLAKNRQEILEKVSDLRDEARRNGIPANTLP
jgi:hypothetical protein